MEEFSLKTIGEYRARYPQLRELTDYQLTRAVYDTTAPDMPLEDFAKAFGGGDGRRPRGTQDSGV